MLEYVPETWFMMEHAMCHRRRLVRWDRALVLAGAIAVSSAPPVAAQITVQTVATGLTQPLAFVQDPAFTNVAYVIEQGGLVRIILDGQLQSAVFADLRALTASGGERGLLGMAFSTTVASGRVFFNYTNLDGDTVISRYMRKAGSPLQIDSTTRFDLRWPGGERVIHQPFSNHNGGDLAFGPDGYLYIGLGDGGSANDPQNNAQNPNTLLGKMLRIDVDVPDTDPAGYRVPLDNPFLDGIPIAALGEIWAFGYRNPWRYSFDNFGPYATGALFVGDVGQNAREEIDYEPAGSGGRNYGWRMREGFIATPGIPPTTPAYLPLTEPLLDYDRTVGQTVIGGYVYRGTALGAAYVARYFFADFSTSRVWSIRLPTPTPLVGGAARACFPIAPSSACSVPVPALPDFLEHTGELGGALGGVASFGRDAAGEMYLLTFNGRLLKIVPAAGPVSIGAPRPQTEPRATRLPAIRR